MKTIHITLEGGKYTYVREPSARQYALRYGTMWRDLIGDKFVLALAQRIEELEEELAKIRPSKAG